MRIPLITEADSRDGSSNKDERLTNVLAEIDSENMACVRPGINTLLASSGAGNGLECFNGQIIHVFGTSIKRGTAPTNIGTVSSGFYDFVKMP